MSKIKTMTEVIKLFKNWPTYFADYFKLIKRKRIVFELRNGIKYEARSNTADRRTINEIWIFKDYTPEGFEINEKDVVLDIGAHIGIFSIFASEFARKGKVYAFEPVLENFEILKHNLEINKINNIIPMNKAVSDKTGSRKMFFLENNTVEHSFYTGWSNLSKSAMYKTKEIDVETISLIDFIDNYGIRQIDFLKMDCEGTEYEILSSCPDDVLKIIRKMSIEYHNIDNNLNGLSLKKFLEGKGFKVNIKPHEINLAVGMCYCTAE